MLLSVFYFYYFTTMSYCIFKRFCSTAKAVINITNSIRSIVHHKLISSYCFCAVWNKRQALGIFTFIKKNRLKHLEIRIRNNYYISCIGISFFQIIDHSCAQSVKATHTA